MEKTVFTVSDQQMEEVHEQLLRVAEAREALPGLDLARVSEVASRAFWAAQSEGKSLEEAEYGLVAALQESSADSLKMRVQAIKDLNDQPTQPQPVLDRAPRREFLSELLSGAVVPFSVAAAVYWVAVHYGQAKTEDVLLVVVLVLFVVAAAAVVFYLLRKLIMGNGRTASSGSVNRYFRHSHGTVVAGLAMTAVLGFYALTEGDRKQNHEIEISLEKLNQGVAVAVAASRAEVTLAKTQKAVDRATAVDWVKVRSLPTTGDMVLARAESPQLLVHAEARVVNDASAATGRTLASYVVSKSGETRWADYVVGKVVAADLDSVTIEVSPQNRKIVSLPSGTLPPPVGTEVVAAVNRVDGKATFLQSIDTVLLGLKK